MSQVYPGMRDFAARLIAHETRGTHAAATNSPVVFQVVEKLRSTLSTLMGDVGFNALLARALVLASPQVPWLRAVQVTPEGSLAGLEELAAQADPAELAEGRVVLVAQLLGLLVAFIGESLMQRLVREVWTDLPPPGKNQLTSKAGNKS